MKFRVDDTMHGLGRGWGSRLRRAVSAPVRRVARIVTRPVQQVARSAGQVVRPVARIALNPVVAAQGALIDPLRRAAQSSLVRTAVFPMVAMNRQLLQLQNMRQALPFAALIPGPVGLAAGALVMLDRVRQARKLSKDEQVQYDQAAEVIAANVDQVQQAVPSAVPAAAPTAAPSAASSGDGYQTGEPVPAATSPQSQDETELEPEEEQVDDDETPEPAATSEPTPEAKAQFAQFVKQWKPELYDRLAQKNLIEVEDDEDYDSEVDTMQGIGSIKDYDTEGYFYRDSGGGYDDAGFAFQFPEYQASLQGLGESDWLDMVKEAATGLVKNAAERKITQLQASRAARNQPPLPAPVAQAQAQSQLAREAKDRINWPMVAGVVGVIAVGGWFLTRGRRRGR